MYITKEELENRLKKTDIQIKEKERKQRTDLGPRLTHEDRVSIGVMSELGTVTEVADLMGVSPATVTNNSRGIVTHDQGVNKKLKDDVSERRALLRKEKEATIADKLLDTLATSVAHVANNITGTDALDASNVAVNMAKVLEKFGGGKEKDGGHRTAIIINVPPMKDEKHYQTIDV